MNTPLIAISILIPLVQALSASIEYCHRLVSTSDLNSLEIGLVIFTGWLISAQNLCFIDILPCIFTT